MLYTDEYGERALAAVGREAKQALADELDVNAATIYRWAARRRGEVIEQEQAESDYKLLVDSLVEAGLEGDTKAATAAIKALTPFMTFEAGMRPDPHNLMASWGGDGETQQLEVSDG